MGAKVTFNETKGKRYYNVASFRSANGETSSEYYFLIRSKALDFAKTQSLKRGIYEVWVSGFNEKRDEVLRLWYQDGECVGEYIGDTEEDEY